MLPVIALVGRPNVGKSTLFNRLTRSRDALVANQPGLTRDRQYGLSHRGDFPAVVIDTGGLMDDAEGLDDLTSQQARLAIAEADIVLFLVDGFAGLNAVDEQIATQLRRAGKPAVVVVNKTDRLDPEVGRAEFHALGLGEPLAIAAVHGTGVESMMAAVKTLLPEDFTGSGTDPEDELSGIRVAIVGRPNVGKSTLVNRILGEERVVVFDQPGTTRDSVFIPFERDGQQYTLIDTAGVRRRARINEAIEKFSVVKTLQAIERANVVVFLLDAHQEVAEQDASLLGFVLDSGRALVLAVNKWDGLDTSQRDWIRKEVERRLPFLSYIEPFYISALHGTGVGDLYAAIDDAYESAMRDLSTPELTRILEAAVEAHQPPLVHGRRIKLRYAHQGGQNPPRIIIHGNQTASLPGAYKRYLANYFREKLDLKGTPVRLEYKTGDNPYKGRRNKLTPRQQDKRRRMMKHVKGKK